MSVIVRIQLHINAFIKLRDYTPCFIYLGVKEYEELTLGSLQDVDSGQIYGLKIFKVNEGSHLNVC